MINKHSILIEIRYSSFFVFTNFMLQKTFLYSCLCLLLIACGNENTTNNNDSNNSNSNEPAALAYAVANVFPHDSTAFTEGLEFRNGLLYEGTGMKGESRLFTYDVATGKEKSRIDLDKQLFGEGITLLNGKIYQMTWEDGKCFVYDANTFKKIQEFTYEGQGWGMTNNGKYLINTNSGSNLYFRDPATFKVVNILGVTDNNGPVGSINELEYINGFIYANIWQTNYIIKINAETGQVVAKADCSNLKQQYFANNTKALEFNGIAYDSTDKRFFVTGKYWPHVFELKGIVP
jgi:glutaminyl-peptide cyclotransferase